MNSPERSVEFGKKNPITEIVSSIDQILKSSKNTNICESEVDDFAAENGYIEAIYPRLPESVEDYFDDILLKKEREAIEKEGKKTKGFLKKLFNKRISKDGSSEINTEINSNVKIIEPIIKKTQYATIETYPDTKKYWLEKVSFSGNLKVSGNPFMLTHDNPLLIIKRVNYDSNDFNHFMYKDTEIKYIIIPRLNKIYDLSLNATDGIDEDMDKPIRKGEELSAAIKNIQNMLIKISPKENI